MYHKFMKVLADGFSNLYGIIGGQKTQFQYSFFSHMTYVSMLFDTSVSLSLPLNFLPLSQAVSFSQASLYCLSFS